MAEMSFYGISGFFEAVSKVGKFALRWDDDAYDRINHRYTAILLVIFTVLVSTKQYVGEPISCWCPATFTDPMIEYTNHICWISNTYFLPMEQVPAKHNVPRSDIIGYYQWVPLVLLFQALLFCTPSIIWAMNNGRNGLSINRVVMLMSGVEHINPEIRDKTIKFICRHFDRALAYQREYRRSRLRRCLQKTSKHFCFPIGTLYGNYLVSLNVFTKILYICNAVGQLWLLNEFLSNETNEFIFYGIEVMRAVLNKKQPDTRMFPRITLCDFKIRQMQNVHDYTVQCALPINLFNEKIYIFLWFWIAFVALITLYGLLAMMWSCFTISQVSYVSRYLRVTNKYKSSSSDKKAVTQFVQEYLRQDGVFALRLVALNTNDVLAAEVIGAMFDYYKTHSFRSPVGELNSTSHIKDANSKFIGDVL